MLIGFKRAYVQPLDESGSADGSLIVIEGTQDEGATMEAAISGLSSDPVKVYGSDIAYYVSQKGTGDVSTSLTLLDLPAEAEARMLGQEKDATFGSYLVGEDTEPPYCAVILESSDQLGNVAQFGFFKGKFSKADETLKSKEEGNYTPEGEAYTYAAVNCDTDLTAFPESKGKAMAKFIGDATTAASFAAAVLRTGV